MDKRHWIRDVNIKEYEFAPIAAGEFLRRELLEAINFMESPSFADL